MTRREEIAKAEYEADYPVALFPKLSDTRYLDYLGYLRRADRILSLLDAEREACAKVMESDPATIRLHAGELSATEMRAVKAVLAWKAAAIRARGDK